MPEGANPKNETHLNKEVQDEILTAMKRITAVGINPTQVIQEKVWKTIQD